MKSELKIAQKGLVLDHGQTKLLVIKYSDGKYLSDKIKDKLALPGGKIEFGETPDESFIKEVEEETGIVIEPLLPFYTWTWTYQKENSQIQIVAIGRLAKYRAGDISTPKQQIESTIEKALWINLTEINLADFVEDEQPIIQKFLEYRQNNPFILT